MVIDPDIHSLLAEQLYEAAELLFGEEPLALNIEEVEELLKLLLNVCSRACLPLNVLHQFLQTLNFLVYPGYFEALVELLARLLYRSFVGVFVLCHGLHLLTVEGHRPVVQDALVLLHPLEGEEAVVLVVVVLLLLALLLLSLTDQPVSLVPLGVHPLVLIIGLD